MKKLDDIVEKLKSLLDVEDEELRICVTASETARVE